MAGEASPGLLIGSDSPVIRADFKLSSSSSSSVGDYRRVDTSSIIFIFDLIGTLIEANGTPIESAMQFITTIRQICMATRKIPIFFIYSEYLPREEQLSKIRAIKQRLGFSFNSFSRLSRRGIQLKKYNAVVEIYDNTFKTDLERVTYPVFFFDDSLDQVISMHSSARRAFKDNPQMYFRSFHILDNTAWNYPLSEVMPIIQYLSISSTAASSAPSAPSAPSALLAPSTAAPSAPSASSAPSAPSAPSRLNLSPHGTSNWKNQLSPLLNIVESPSLKRQGGKRSRKNKIKAKKSRKHLRN
jgi:hypothetical protein